MVMLLKIFFSILAGYMQRVDLIQDLRFETATTRIKVTPDGEYLIASGDYVQFKISFFLFCFLKILFFC